jgi:ribosomal protein L37E
MDTGQPVETKQDNRITFHCACVQCGYDLFAAPESGRCPECGHSCAASLQAAAWLRTPQGAMHLAAALQPMVVTAVLSGLCVLAAWWVVLGSSGGSNIILATLVSTAAVVLTLLFARQCSSSLAKAWGDSAAGQRIRKADVLDMFAGMGLLGLLLAQWAAMLFKLLSSSDRVHSNAPFLILAWMAMISFALLGLTTLRFRFFYYAIALSLSQLRQTSVAFWTRRLGDLKMVYEFLWLAVCCAGAIALLLLEADEVGLFLAYGALLGTFGFGIVWIAMIVMHSIIAVTFKRQLRRG